MSTLHLEKLLDPASVVVIGASARVGSPGLAIVRNIVDGGFDGRLHLVNPRYTEVLGRPCHKALKSIDEVPDIAFVLTPKRLLRRTLVQCSRHGVKLVIVMSDADKPEALHEHARRLGIRLLGPWCAGLMLPHHRLNATMAINRLQPGSLAVISQSATLAAALVDWAEWSGVGFSALLSTGGDTDIRLPDLLDLLASDHRTRAIIVYLDHVRSSRAFLSALAAAARSKPVVLMKSTQDGARYCDALTRTGQIFSSDAAFHAALGRAGVVRIRTFSNLFASAKILSSRVRTRGRSLAVLSNGAAPAMLACESLEQRGFRSPLFDAATLESVGLALGQRTGNKWTGGNPLILRDGPRLVEQYRRALAVLADSKEFDALLVIFVPDSRNDPALIASALIDVLPTRLPMIACLMGETSVAPAREALADAGIPNFRTPEAACDGFDFLYRYHRSQQQLLQLPNPTSRITSADIPAARALVEVALAAGRRVLGPQETRTLMRLFDIEVLPAKRAESLEEAVAAALAIGYPVALKLVSPNLAYKAPIVRTALGLADDGALREAFERARTRLAERRPDAEFRGVLIEKMHSVPDGRELALGLHTDPTFGPLISIGIGGDLTALLQHRAIQLPPLNNFLVNELLEDRYLANYLGEFRHSPAIDTAPIASVLRRLSELACEVPEVFSLDINPLVVSDGRAVAIDVQVVLEQPPSTRRYGHLSIHPYPLQWVRKTTLRGGREVTLRPIRPEDGVSLGDMVRAMSAESRYFRFMHAMNELSPLLLAQFTKLDYDRQMAFVADPGDGTIAGASRYSIESDRRSGEFAVSVADDWQGVGLATALMRQLIEHAREQGLERLWGDVLRNNTAMHALMRSLGFKSQASGDDHDVLIFSLDLQHPATA